MASNVRDLFVTLGNSDADARQGALRALAGLSNSAAGLGRLMADATSLPRTCYFVAGLGESPSAPDPVTVQLSLSLLWRMLQHDDGLSAPIVVAECGSRPILSILKTCDADPLLVIPAFRILKLLQKLEKGMAMAARVEGCVDLLLECLKLEPRPEELALQLHAASAALLAAYCRGSDNNMRIFVRKHGLARLVTLMPRAAAAAAVAGASGRTAAAQRADGSTLAAGAVALLTQALRNDAYVHALLEVPDAAAALLGAVAAHAHTPAVAKPGVALLATLAAFRDGAAGLWAAGAPAALWALVLDYAHFASSALAPPPLAPLSPTSASGRLRSASEGAGLPSGGAWAVHPTPAQCRGVLKSATAALWALLASPPPTVLAASALPPLTADVTTELAAQYKLPAAAPTQVATLEPANARLFSPALYSRFHPQTLPSAGGAALTHQLALHTGAEAVPAPLPPGLLLTSTTGRSATRGPGGINMNATRVWPLPTRYGSPLPRHLDAALAAGATAALAWARPAAEAGGMPLPAARGGLPWHAALPGAYKLLLLQHLPWVAEAAAQPAAEASVADATVAEGTGAGVDGAATELLAGAALVPPHSPIVGAAEAAPPPALAPAVAGHAWGSAAATAGAALALAATAHPRTLTANANVGPGARPFPDGDLGAALRAVEALATAGACTVTALLAGPGVAPDTGAAAGSSDGAAAEPSAPLVQGVRSMQRLASDRSAGVLAAPPAPPSPDPAPASDGEGGVGEGSLPAGSGTPPPASPTPPAPAPASPRAPGHAVALPVGSLPTPPAPPYAPGTEAWTHVPHWFPELQLAAASDVATRTAWAVAAGGTADATAAAAALPAWRAALATPPPDGAVPATLMDILRAAFPHLAPEGWQAPPAAAAVAGAQPWAWHMLHDPTYRAVLLPVAGEAGEGGGSALPEGAAAGGTGVLTPTTALAPPLPGGAVPLVRPVLFPPPTQTPAHPPHLFLTPTGIAATRAWVLPASRLPSVLQAGPPPPLVREHMVPVAAEQRHALAQRLVLQAVARIVRDMGIAGPAPAAGRSLASVVYNVYGPPDGTGAASVPVLEAPLPPAVPRRHWAAVSAAYATQMYDSELGLDISPPLPLSPLCVPLIKGARRPTAAPRTPAPATGAGAARELTASSASGGEEEEEDGVGGFESGGEAAPPLEDVQDREGADDVGAVSASPDALRRAVASGRLSPTLASSAGRLEALASPTSPASPPRVPTGDSASLPTMGRAAALGDTDEDTLARAVAVDMDAILDYGAEGSGGDAALAPAAAAAAEEAPPEARIAPPALPTQASPSWAHATWPPALSFESRFESGNLRAAARVGPREYELTLEPDTNTVRHTQWFYFAVTGMQTPAGREGLWGTPQPPAEYTFHIVNLEKTDSSYNHGMRPVVYFVGADGEEGSVWDDWLAREGEGAEAAAAPYALAQSARRLWLPPLPGGGWRRAGAGVVYYQNHYSKVKAAPAVPRAVLPWAGGEAEAPAHGAGDSEDEEGDSDGAEGPATSKDGAAPVGRLYSETFRVAFPPGTRAAFLAYCFPYTYTDLGLDVARWQWRAARVAAGADVGITEFAHPPPEWAGNPLTPEPGSEAALHGAQDGHNELCASRHPERHTAATAHASFPSPPTPTGRPAPEGALFSSGILVRSTLCASLAGNPLPLLTITDFGSGVQGAGEERGVLPTPAAPLPPAGVPLHARPLVVLSARVHPGETNASWMMRGVLDVLTASAPLAAAARARAVWKVVPFLNPDGVLNGHHRTNLAGVDLNRHWTAPTPSIAPSVWHMKRLLLTAQRRGRVALFCDFHGHSRRKNVFTFGCEVTVGSAGPAAAKEAEGWSAWVQKLFPALLAARADDFALKNCSFKVQKSKANCARVAAWRDTPLVNSFTIEASFAGADQGAHAGSHFSTRNYEEMGHHFAASLSDLLAYYHAMPSAGAVAGVAPVAPTPPAPLEALLSLPHAAASAGAAAAAGRPAPIAPPHVATQLPLAAPAALASTLLRALGVPPPALRALGGDGGGAYPPALPGGASGADVLAAVYGAAAAAWPLLWPAHLATHSGAPLALPASGPVPVAGAAAAAAAVLGALGGDGGGASGPFPWRLALAPLRTLPPAGVADLMATVRATPRLRASGGASPARPRRSLAQARSAASLRPPPPSALGNEELAGMAAAWLRAVRGGGLASPVPAPLVRVAGVAAALAKAAAAAAKKAATRKRTGLRRRGAGRGKGKGKARTVKRPAAEAGAGGAAAGGKKKTPVRRRRVGGGKKKP